MEKTPENVGDRWGNTRLTYLFEGCRRNWTPDWQVNPEVKRLTV
jgi:hypothetical protein